MHADVTAYLDELIQFPWHEKQIRATANALIMKGQILLKNDGIPADERIPLQTLIANLPVLLDLADLNSMPTLSQNHIKQSLSELELINPESEFYPTARHLRVNMLYYLAVAYYYSIQKHTLQPLVEAQKRELKRNYLECEFTIIDCRQLLDPTYQYIETQLNALEIGLALTQTMLFPPLLLAPRPIYPYLDEAKEQQENGIPDSFYLPQFN